MAERLNILVIPDLFPAYDGDWTGVFVVDYLKAVAPHCNVSVFYSRLAGEHVGTQKEEFAGFPLTRFTLLPKKPKGALKWIAYQNWIRKSAKAAFKLPKPDLIHAHSATLYGSLGLELARYWNIPLVVSEHTGPFSTISASKMKLLKCKKVMQRADATLAVSEHLAREIRAAGIEPKNLIVSGNPVDTDLFIPNTEKKTHQNMLFISRLDEFKGGMRTLRAFHNLEADHPNWTLTIGGDGEEMQAIKTYISAHDLGNNVFLKGKLTKPQIAKEFQAADFLIFPSVHESFGLIPAEAMSAGLPVIATNKTAPPEFVHGKNGILVTPESESEILEAMVKMIKELDDFDGDKIRAEMVERFGFEIFGKRLIELYDSL
jgi:glycosyltransferase involved in cell wall biosynthesis